MNAWREWYRAREAREKTLITFASFIVAFVLLYSLVWAPLATEYQSKRDSVEKLRKDVLWMREAVVELRVLGQSHSSTPTSPVSQESLPTLLERTARAVRLQDIIRRIEPLGEDKAQLTFENAGFNELMIWLDLLRRQHSLNVNTVNIERGQAAGQVSGRLAFNRL